MPKGGREITSSGNRGGEDGLIRRLAPFGVLHQIVTTAMPSNHNQKTSAKILLAFPTPPQLYTTGHSYCVPSKTLGIAGSRFRTTLRSTGWPDRLSSEGYAAQFLWDLWTDTA